MFIDERHKHHDLGPRCNWCYEVHNIYIGGPRDDVMETKKSNERSEVRLMSLKHATARRPV